MKRIRAKKSCRVAVTFFFSLMFMLPQTAVAQSLRNFKKAMEMGRGTGKPYQFRKELGVNTAKAYKVAKDNNFIIVAHGDEIVKFVPQNEYDAYMAERDFTQRGLFYDILGEWHPDYYVRRRSPYWCNDMEDCEYFYYDWYNKQLRGGDFKSMGTAWLYDGDKFIKLDSLRWTGGVKNGMLEGNGDGFIVRVENGKKVYRSFSGGFKGGSPNGDFRMHQTIYSKPDENAVYPFNYPFKKKTAACKVGDFSDGMASMEVTIDGNKKIGFIDQQFNISIPLIFKAVKKNFQNGKATVSYFREGRIADLVIDKTFSNFVMLDGPEKLPDYFFKIKELKSMKSIVLPSSLKKIGYHLFMPGSKLEKVKMGENITEIATEAFEYCSSLTSIEIPSSVTTIGKSVFDGCRSLTSASVPESIVDKVVGKAIFSNCEKLEAVSIRKANGTTAKDNKWYWFETIDPAIKQQQEYAARRNQQNKSVSSRSVSPSDVMAMISNKNEGWSGGRALDSDDNFTDHKRVTFYSDAKISSVSIWWRHQESSVLRDAYYFKDNSSMRWYKTFTQAVYAAYMYKAYGEIITDGSIEYFY